jgi:hypothetical protein
MTTIRDVVVKIRLEQQQAKLTAPDATAVRDLFRQLKEEHAAIYRGTGPGLSAGAGVAGGDESLRKMREQVKPLKTELDGLLPPLRSVGVDLDKISKSEADKSLEKFNRLAVQSRRSAFEAAEGLKRAGEGVFTLARGVALLSASGDEELRVVLERIAMFQGAFDIFKGGTDVIVGTVKAYQGLRAATIAQAAANNTLAVSEVALAGARAGSGGLGGVTSALPSLGTAAKLGLPGLAIAGVGLTLAAMKLPGEEAGVDFAGQANSERLAREQQALQQRYRDQQRDFLPLDRQLEMERGRAIGNMTPGRFRDISFISRSDVGPTATGGTSIRAAAASGVTELRGDTDAGMAQADLLIEKNKTLIQRLEERKAAEENIYRLITQQKQGRIDELDTIKQQLELSKQQAAAEQGRLQSFEERLGRLSPGQLQQLTKLRDKAAGGEELNARELSRLEELGGPATSRFVGKQFAERGRERGGAGFFAGIDDGVVSEAQTALADANTRIAQILSEFGGSAQGITDEMENVKNSLIAAQTQQSATLAQIVEALKEAATKNAALENEVAKLKESRAKGKSR